MTLFELWDLTSYIAGKFPSAGVVPPSRFNLLLPQVQDELYQAAVKGREIPMLDRFKKSATLVPGEDSIAALPEDYRRILSAVALGIADDSAAVAVPWTRTMEIVGEAEYAMRQGNAMYRALELPFAKIQDGCLYPVPTNITTITIDYLRAPTTPYLDWCQLESNLNKIVYVPEGATIIENQVTGNYDLMQGATVLQANVYKTMGADVYTSQTIELDWEEQYHYRFVSLLLGKIGVNLGEFEVAKYAETMPR
jgi:hypothetical protein